MRCIRRSVWIGLALSIVFGAAGGAEESGILPQRGQSPEQMERDKAECLAAALAATAVTPAEALPPAAEQAPAAEPPAPSSESSPPAASQVPAVKAQGASAKRPGLFGGLRRADDAPGTDEEPPTDASAATEQDQTAFDLAYTECLKARGYTVN